MIKASRRRNARAIAAGKLEVVQADMTQLPFAPSQFDTIWSIHTVYFWADQTQVLTELARVLKAGGLLVLALSPGKVGASIAHDVQVKMEERVSTMQQLGFTTSQKQGPASRQFQTVGIIEQGKGTREAGKAKYIFK